MLYGCTAPDTFLVILVILLLTLPEADEALELLYKAPLTTTLSPILNLLDGVGVGFGSSLMAGL